jgi:hypothetical protein
MGIHRESPFGSVELGVQFSDHRAPGHNVRLDLCIHLLGCSRLRREDWPPSIADISSLSLRTMATVHATAIGHLQLMQALLHEQVVQQCIFGFHDAFIKTNRPNGLYYCKFKMSSASGFSLCSAS